MKSYHFRAQNDPFAQKSFFKEKPLNSFHVPFGHFHYAKFQKIP